MQSEHCYAKPSGAGVGAKKDDSYEDYDHVNDVDLWGSGVATQWVKDEDEDDYDAWSIEKWRWSKDEVDNGRAGSASASAILPSRSRQRQERGLAWSPPNWGAPKYTEPKPYYSPPANNYYPPSAPTPYYYYPASPKFVETCCSSNERVCPMDFPMQKQVFLSGKLRVCCFTRRVDGGGGYYYPGYGGGYQYQTRTPRYGYGYGNRNRKLQYGYGGGSYTYGQQSSYYGDSYAYGLPAQCPANQITPSPTKSSTKAPTKVPTLEPSSEPSNKCADGYGFGSPSTPDECTECLVGTTSAIVDGKSMCVCDNGADNPWDNSGPCGIELDFVFDGLDEAGSMERGVISIVWDFPHYTNGEIVDLESVRYHILSYAGIFDFKSALESPTYSAEDLVSDFELQSSADVTGKFQYYREDDGEVFEFNLVTSFYGEMHYVMVIAEVNGVYSRNTDSMHIRASEVDPVVKTSVNIVGFFLPTDLLNITLTVDQNNNAFIQFEGPVTQDHKDVVVGDYVHGILTILKKFFYQVTSVVESNDQRVVLGVGDVPKLEDIFDALDYGMSISMSRPDKVETSVASRERHRHLIQRRQRRLGDRRMLGWFGAIVKFVGDNIVEPIKEVAEALVDFVESGELSMNFNLISFDFEETYDIPDISPPNQKPTPKPTRKPTLKPTPKPTPRSDAEDGEVKVNIVLRSDIYVSLKLSFSSPLVRAEAGWSASYSADFSMAMFGVMTFSHVKELKRFAPKIYTFTVGWVPVVLDVTPVLNGEFSATATANDGDGAVQLKLGASGGTSLGGVGELSPGKIDYDFQSPTLNPYFEYELLSKINIQVGLYLIPTLEVNLYAGAVTGSLSVSVGTKLSADFSVDAILDLEPCEIFDGMNVTLGLDLGVSIGTKYKPNNEIDLDIFEAEFPILEIDGTECPDPNPDEPSACQYKYELTTTNNGEYVILEAASWEEGGEIIDTVVGGVPLNLYVTDSLVRYNGGKSEAYKCSGHPYTAYCNQWSPFKQDYPYHDPILSVQGWREVVDCEELHPGDGAFRVFDFTEPISAGPVYASNGDVLVDNEGQCVSESIGGGWYTGAINSHDYFKVSPPMKPCQQCAEGKGFGTLANPLECIDCPQNSQIVDGRSVCS